MVHRGRDSRDVCEAGIKDGGMWQTAEREERRAQAHGAEQG